MSAIPTPNDRKFTSTHEWVKIDAQTAVVGISDHAQKALGDITFVELPSAGRKVAKGESCSVIESVKAASDVYSPVSGEICEVNSALETKPEMVNKDPYGYAWLFKIRNLSVSDLNGLMDGAAYDAFAEKDK